MEMGIIYTSLALSALPEWDDRARNAWSQFAADIVFRQAADGSFPDGVGRPPILERQEATTALAVLALSPPESEAGRLPDAASSRARAMEWLAKNPTGGSHQAQVLRLLILTRTGAPAEAARGLIAEMVNRQSPDGGWSQTTLMASDALATGQTLYALRAAGMPADDPAIRRGVAFLIKSQRPEGDWPMPSRPVPGQPDGGPSKDLTPITAAGSAWAVLGLARAAPR
jgi:squalene-hopene cyclase-like protein